MSRVSEAVRIAFLGDTHLGLQKVSLGPELSTLLEGCDHVVVNLESPICKPSPIDSSKILLRTEPGLESILSDLHVTAVTFANNHIFDHGLEGFRSTLQALEARQILFAGAGENSRQAACPLILDCKGIRVGVISCTEPVTEAQIAAPNAPGCNHLQVPDISCQIRKIKAGVDFVVVAPHWGFCDYAYPPAEVVSCGEQLLAAGADMIIAHHSHVLQGVRHLVDGRFVAYSLGDFFFDSYSAGGRVVNPSAENRKGLGIIIEFLDGKVSGIQPIFTRYSDSVIELHTTIEREIELKRRSAPFGSLKKYPAYWRSVVHARLLQRITFWGNPVRWRHIRLATVRAALIMIWQMVFCGLRIKGRPKDRHR